MEIAPFALERWLDRYEQDADVMLGESGIRSLPVDRFDLTGTDLGYVIPTDGGRSFRTHLADRYGRDPEEVVVTCGTQEANLLVHLATLDADAHAVVIAPTYQSLATLPETVASATVVRTSPPDWSIDVDRINEACRPNTRLLVLANPANPTGRYEGFGVLAALYEVAEEAGAYLHVDEVYRQLADEPAPPAATLGDMAISTGGVSKAYGLAGARIGWAVAERPVADAIREWKDYTTIAPPTLGQRIAHQALTTQETDILDENRTLARTNRRIVSNFLDRFDLRWHEPVGVLGFPTIPEGFASGQAFCEAVYEATGILLTPGDVFEEADRFRIGFGVPTDVLEEALGTLGTLLDAHRANLG